jgi:hypothetical protein
MENFFRKHIEGFLTGFAVVLLGVVVFCFVWGMVYLSRSLDSVFDVNASVASTTSFNLSGAKALNLRGLVPK